MTGLRDGWELGAVMEGGLAEADVGGVRKMLVWGGVGVSGLDLCRWGRMKGDWVL